MQQKRSVNFMLSIEKMLLVLRYRAFNFVFIDTFPISQTGLKFIIIQPHPLLCDKTFPRSCSTHAYSLQIGKLHRPKYGCHQSPTWWTSDFYWAHLQKLLNDSHITKLRSQLTKLGTWGPLHTLQAAQQVKRVLSTCHSWSKPLSDSSIGFCFF